MVMETPIYKVRKAVADLEVQKAAKLGGDVDPATFTKEDLEQYKELCDKLSAMKEMLADLENEEAEQAKAIKAAKENEDIQGDDNDDEEEDDNASESKSYRTKKTVVKGGKMNRLAAPNVVRNLKSNVPSIAPFAYMMLDTIRKQSGSFSAARDYHAKAFSAVDPNDIVVKTLTATASPSLIPQDFIPTFLDGLWSKSIVRESGAEVIKVKHGNAIAPMLAGANTAYWTAEAVGPAESEPTFQNFRMGAHKIGAQAYVSNDWLRRPDDALDAASIVQRIMYRDMALKMDYAYLLGTSATNSSPTGLVNIPGIQTF